MANNDRVFDLPETKGFYQLRGIVSGTEKDNFYKEKKTATGKDRRDISFGVEFEKGKTVYVGLQAYPKKEVTFYKKGENKQKGTTEKVAWSDRKTFNKEGFNLLGVQLGLTKTVGSDGNLHNDKCTLVEFDACDHIRKNLKDNMSVFIKGKLDYSSFLNNENTLVRSTKLAPTQISLCNSDINLEEEGFEPQHGFTQAIIFMGIEQEVENEKPTGRYLVSAKIVTFSSIEDTTFVMTDPDLARTFKKNLKPYTALKVWGDIETVTTTEEVPSTNTWGRANPMDKITRSSRREFVIVGANPDTIDTELYNRTAIEEAMVKIKNAKNAQADYGNSNSTSAADGWGSVGSVVDEDEVW